MTAEATSTTADARPGKFLDKLCVEQTSRWQWMVLSPLRFDDPQFGVIPVPVGFRTDFASIRSMRVFLTPLYALLAGYGNAACTVHDMLYGQGILTRAECDGSCSERFGVRAWPGGGLRFSGPASGYSGKVTIHRSSGPIETG